VAPHAARLARSKAADLLYFGALLFFVAWPPSSLMPINKRIWTSTLSLLSRRRQPAGPGRSLLATRSPRRAAPQFRSTRLPIDISLHPGSRTSERAVALNAGLLYPLYRKRIFLRI